MSKVRRILLWLIALALLIPGTVVLAWAVPYPAYRDGRYIPRDLGEAHRELMKILRPDDVQRIRGMKSEFEMIDYHLSLGMGLRNGWGLWDGSRLSRRLNLMGLWHPDEMSAVIRESFWCHLHGQPYRLKEREARRKDYWNAWNN